MSITRVVQVAFKTGLDAEVVKKTLDSVKAMKQNCVSPATQKPYIQSLQAGRDASPEPLNGGFTHQFVIVFENAEDRDYYSAKDPAHLSVIALLDPYVDKVQIVDIVDGEF